jgi:type IV secretory pathway VirB2 component (pilin)
MNKLTKFVMAAAIVLVLAAPLFALAQPSVVLPADPGLPGTADQDIETIVFNIIQAWLLPIAGIIAVLFIIIGGFQYILSGANEDLAKQGRTTLRNAVVGLIIILVSYVIVTVVVNTLFQL